MSYHGGKHSLRKLHKASNGVCHYCGRKTNREISRLYPTRDHIVPRSFGGPNTMDNYVLACAGCNSERGTNLFYCKCRDCHERVLDALYDPESLRLLFSGIVEHNKPRIKVRRDNGKFSLRIGHQTKNFDTFEQAIEFATTEMSLVRKRNYKGETNE